MIDREFWLQIRQALLMAVDAIEHMKLNMKRTSELRKEDKDKSTRRE